MDRIDNKEVYRSRTLVADYDVHRRIDENDFVNEVELQFFVNAARRLGGPGASIVDFGAGTGKLALAFARLGHRVTALDQSEAMLERLRTKADAEGLAIDCRLHDIVSDVPPSGHDVAVSSRVLMHVADPAKMISAMAAAASKGVVLDVPRRLSPNTLWVGVRAISGGEVYRRFDDDNLRKLVAEVGLDAVETARLFVIPIGLHLALRSLGTSRLLEQILAPLRPFASTLFLAASHRGAAGSSSPY